MSLVDKYEELMKLLEEEPFQFEREVRDLINSYISTLPKDRQLRAKQLQWRIDGELRQYKNPIVRMNKMMELFYDGLNKFNDTLWK